MEIIKEIEGQKFVCIPLMEYRQKNKIKANSVITRLSSSELNIAKLLISYSCKSKNVTLTRIANETKMSLPTVSKLVRKLESADVLKFEFEGRKGTNISVLNDKFADMVSKI